MSQIQFVSPALKRSTKDFPILNENNETIGYMQRFYTGKVSHILDYIFTGMFLNIRVLDLSKNVIAEAIEKVERKDYVKFTRQNWNVKTKHYGTLKLLDKTKINTHPRYEIYINNEPFKIKKDFGERTMYILNSSDQTIAEATFEEMILPKTYTVKVIKPAIDIYLIACLFYILILRD
ncbi:hypothetical protein [Rummeliibacillus sp. POC4]|uniref:tubby C-terminal domain-like protein n=1 Tax=Rummeliibacillus sp. POC4 TaxID=2305899 RepID=UPI000E67456B|nr:hypothetical protein [Rummeliibacillus sp. POC4]RIJ66958.1 hypothetical protein D1606_05495 [Rummeliibacillus sp. POC4]